jgi:hypothetical protein
VLSALTLNGVRLAMPTAAEIAGGHHNVTPLVMDNALSQSI